jgi:hypothetical protein
MGKKFKDKKGSKHDSSKFEFPLETNNTFIAKVIKCNGESQFHCCDIENPAIVYIAKIRAGMRKKGEALVLKEGSIVLLFDRRNPEVKYTYSEKDVEKLREQGYINDESDDKSSDDKSSENVVEEKMNNLLQEMSKPIITEETCIDFDDI